MDIIKIYTNSNKLMDLDAAKLTIISIAKKFHLNHINYLFENNFSDNSDYIEIPCEIQIEPYLDSECTVDFFESKNELTTLYGNEYNYFSKTGNLHELNLFILKLKKEHDTIVKVGQLYKIYEFFKFKCDFAKTQNISIANEIFEDLNELGKDLQKLFPNEEILL